MTTACHSFDASLRASHDASDWPGWENLYREIFHPRFKAMIDFREDGPHQRAGVDRVVVTTTADLILIDEKVRGRNDRGEVYKDIFLETLSDSRRLTPGWVIKPLRAHYIAYLIAPLGRCHMLPVVPLQAAWLRYGPMWTDRYGVREAVNEGWITAGVPVPVDELFRAIGGAHHSSFEPFEFGVRR